MIYQLFVPFFFIHVGMQVTPEALRGYRPGTRAACRRGPRQSARESCAEHYGRKPVRSDTPYREYDAPRRCALLVTQQAEAMGYISREVLSAMVFVSAATCLLAPWALEHLLRREAK